AATAAIRHAVELQSPLPFPREDYLGDFPEGPDRVRFLELLAEADRNAVFELPGTRLEPDLAYESVGLVALRQSDLLIAVWDGKIEDRKRGGTTDIVAKALEAGIPVIWFKPDDLETPRLLSPTLSPTTSIWVLPAKAPVLDAYGLSTLVRGLT